MCSKDVHKSFIAKTSLSKAKNISLEQTDIIIIINRHVSIKEVDEKVVQQFPNPFSLRSVNSFLIITINCCIV